MSALGRLGLSKSLILSIAGSPDALMSRYTSWTDVRDGREVRKETLLCSRLRRRYR